MKTRGLLLAAFVLALSCRATAGDSLLSRLQDEIRGLARKAGPAVVRVTSERHAGVDGAPDLRALLRQSNTVGSGFLVSEKGYVVTTEGVARGAETARVDFPNGFSCRGRVVGSDPVFKVALVKIEEIPPGVKPLALAEDVSLNKGSLGVLLGNSFGITGNLSLAIVAGSRMRADRYDPYDNYVVINAAVHPGDGGGPFLDPDGKVVGMSVASYTGGAVQIMGDSMSPKVTVREIVGPGAMGLVVPADDLRYAVNEIENYGRVRTSYLGFKLKPGTLEVELTQPGSPAEQAGFFPGDVFLAVGGRRVRSPSELGFLLRRSVVGQDIEVRVRRDGRTVVVNAVPLDLTSIYQAYFPGVSLLESGVPVVVLSVDKNGRETGLRENDIIVSVNGQPVTSAPHVLRVLRSAEPGAEIKLSVLRGRSKIDITVPPVR